MMRRLIIFVLVWISAFGGQLGIYAVGTGDLIAEGRSFFKDKDYGSDDEGESGERLSVDGWETLEDERLFPHSPAIVKAKFGQYLRLPLDGQVKNFREDWALFHQYLVGKQMMDGERLLLLEGESLAKWEAMLDSAVGYETECLNVRDQWINLYQATYWWRYAWGLVAQIERALTGDNFDHFVKMIGCLKPEQKVLNHFALAKAFLKRVRLQLIQGWVHFYKYEVRGKVSPFYANEEPLGVLVDGGFWWEQTAIASQGFRLDEEISLVDFLQISDWRVVPERDLYELPYRDADCVSLKLKSIWSLPGVEALKIEVQDLDMWALFRYAIINRGIQDVYLKNLGLLRKALERSELKGAPFACLHVGRGEWSREDAAALQRVVGCLADEDHCPIIILREGAAVSVQAKKILEQMEGSYLEGLSGAREIFMTEDEAYQKMFEKVGIALTMAVAFYFICQICAWLNEDEVFEGHGINGLQVPLNQRGTMIEYPL